MKTAVTGDFGDVTGDAGGSVCVCVFISFHRKDFS